MIPIETTIDPEVVKQRFDRLDSISSSNLSYGLNVFSKFILETFDSDVTELNKLKKTILNHQSILKNIQSQLTQLKESNPNYRSTKHSYDFHKSCLNFYQGQFDKLILSEFTDQDLESLKSYFKSGLMKTSNGYDFKNEVKPYVNEELDRLSYEIVFRNKIILSNQDSIDSELELKLFDRFPLLVYFLMIRTDITKLENHINTLLELIESKPKINHEVKTNLNDLIRYCQHFKSTTSTTSSDNFIIRFNGLVGIDFNNSPHLNSNQFVIHLGFNYPNRLNWISKFSFSEQNDEIDIVNYNLVERSKLRRLEFETHECQVSYQIINSKSNDNSRLESKVESKSNDNSRLESKDDSIDFSNKYEIVLCYDDKLNSNGTIDLRNSHKSFSKLVFTKSEIDLLIQGGILFPPSYRTMITYFNRQLQLRFQNKQPERVESNFKTEIVKLINSNYDQSIQQTIDNWMKWNKNNDEWLDIYLQSLNEFVYDDVLSKDDYINSMLTYFFDQEEVDDLKLKF